MKPDSCRLSYHLDVNDSLNIDSLYLTNQAFQFQNHCWNDLCPWPRCDPLTTLWPCSDSMVTSLWPCCDPCVTRWWHHSQMKILHQKLQCIWVGPHPSWYAVQSGGPLIILEAGVSAELWYRAGSLRAGLLWSKPASSLHFLPAHCSGLPQPVTSAPGLWAHGFLFLWSHSDESCDHALASGAGMKPARCLMDGHTETRAVCIPVTVSVCVRWIN